MCCTPTSLHSTWRVQEGEGKGLWRVPGCWRQMEACCAHGDLLRHVSPSQVVLSLGDLFFGGGSSSHSIPEMSSFSAKC